MLLVLELREGDRQKVQEFKVILDCLVNLRPVQEMRDPFLKIKKEEKNYNPLLGSRSLIFHLAFSETWAFYIFFPLV